MTAVIHHGPPGSFKSFSIVQRVMIDALKQGRVVVTNIRGFNDIHRVEETMGLSFPDTAKIYAVDADSAEGFDHIARFFHWAPAGALIVIDEAQRAYPTRLRSFSEFDQADDVILCNDFCEPFLDSNGEPINRPATLENAFDQHRHCNWDIYLSTPNIAKIHKEIRSVCEWAFRHRDITGLNPFSTRQKWREFKHDSETSGKSVSHYFGTPDTYRVDKRVFACYQSTKTGKAKDSNENISVLRDRKVQLAIGIVILSIITMGSQVSTVIDRYSSDNPEASVAVHHYDWSRPQPIVNDDSDYGSSRGYRPLVAEGAHPLDGFTLRYVGSINDDLLFHAYIDDQQYITLRLSDLETTGYHADAITTAFVRLSHETRREIYAFSEPRIKPGAETMERSYASEGVPATGVLF